MSEFKPNPIVKGLNTYQDIVNSTRNNQPDLELTYPILSLVSRTGKLAEAYCNVISDKAGVLGFEETEVLAVELGNCLYHLTTIVSDIGYTLEEIVALSIGEKLKGK